MERTLLGIHSLHCIRLIEFFGVDRKKYIKIMNEMSNFQ